MPHSDSFAMRLRALAPTVNGVVGELMRGAADEIERLELGKEAALGSARDAHARADGWREKFDADTDCIVAMRRLLSVYVEAVADQGYGGGAYVAPEVEAEARRYLVDGQR